MSESNKTGFAAVHHYSDLYRGGHTRVFDEETHGGGYLSVAKEFAQSLEVGLNKLVEENPGLKNIAKQRKAMLKIEHITSKDADEIAQENRAKEQRRMLQIYKQKGWVKEIKSSDEYQGLTNEERFEAEGKQYRILSPRLLKPGDFGI